MLVKIKARKNENLAEMFQTVRSLLLGADFPAVRDVVIAAGHSCIFEAEVEVGDNLKQVNAILAQINERLDDAFDVTGYKLNHSASEWYGYGVLVGNHHARMFSFVDDAPVDTKAPAHESMAMRWDWK